MKTESKYRDPADWRDDPMVRRELETAWLRGWVAFDQTGGMEDEALMAADYAERVIGGSTRPERPEVER